jgi:hypothetical protein
MRQAISAPLPVFKNTSWFAVFEVLPELRRSLSIRLTQGRGFPLPGVLALLLILLGTKLGGFDSAENPIQYQIRSMEEVFFRSQLPGDSACLQTIERQGGGHGDISDVPAVRTNY